MLARIARSRRALAAAALGLLAAVAVGAAALGRESAEALDPCLPPLCTPSPTPLVPDTPTDTPTPIVPLPSLTLLPTVTLPPLPTITLTPELPTVTPELPTLTPPPLPTITLTPELPSVTPELPTITLTIPPLPTITLTPEVPTVTLTVPPLPTVTLPPLPTVTLPPLPTVTLPPLPTVTLPPLPTVTLPPLPTVTLPPLPTLTITPPVGCLGDVDCDGLPDSYETSYACLQQPLTPDASGDPDGDGATNLQEFSAGSDPCVNDSDADGCADGEELGPNPQMGGDRNPIYYWDFFDVNADKFIDLADVIAVLGKFGTQAAKPGYNPTFDRSEPIPTKRYRTAQATDGVDLRDALASLDSFGHSCAGPP